MKPVFLGNWGSPRWGLQVLLGCGVALGECWPPLGLRFFSPNVG